MSSKVDQGMSDPHGLSKRIEKLFKEHRYPAAILLAEELCVITAPRGRRDYDNLRRACKLRNGSAGARIAEPGTRPRKTIRGDIAQSHDGRDVSTG